MRLSNYQQRELDAKHLLDHGQIDRLVILAMDRRDAGLCDVPGCSNQGDHDRAEEGFYCTDCWKEME